MSILGMSVAVSPLRSAPGRRARLALLAGLLGVAALAWCFSAWKMSKMASMPTGELGPLGVYLTIWVAMMAAMMFPSLAPMVLAHARISAVRRGRGGGTPLFLAGYLVAWSGYGLIAYGAYQAWQTLSASVWPEGMRWTGVIALVAAATYQAMPVKAACLARCRSPFEFLTEQWRDGRSGSLVMGAKHGTWCVGCCWALMMSLFVLGVMSVGWMAAMGAAIAAEKLLPRRARGASLAVAALLLALALTLALAPGALPR